MAEIVKWNGCNRNNATTWKYINKRLPRRSITTSQTHTWLKWKDGEEEDEFHSNHNKVKHVVKCPLPELNAKTSTHHASMRHAHRACTMHTDSYMVLAENSFATLVMQYFWFTRHCHCECYTQENVVCSVFGWDSVAWRLEQFRAKS